MVSVAILQGCAFVHHELVTACGAELTEEVPSQTSVVFSVQNPLHVLLHLRLQGRSGTVRQAGGWVGGHNPLQAGKQSKAKQSGYGVA